MQQKPPSGGFFIALTKNSWQGIHAKVITLEFPMTLIPWTSNTTHGIRLSGLRTQPTGKPLLHFLHGNGFCSQMYWPFLAPLVEHFDLFLSDVQGHGQSEHGGAFIGWNGSANAARDAFLQFRDEYPTNTVIGCGHSFGGVVTALWASQHADFQELWLLDPVIFPKHMYRFARSLAWLGLYKFNPLVKQAKRRRAQFDSAEQATRYFSERALFRTWHPESLQSYVEHGLHHHSHRLELKCAPEREAEIFGSVPKQLWRSLQRVKLPVQVWHGEHSYPFVAKSLKQWQHLCANVQATKVAGGHCFMQEFPTESVGYLIEHWNQRKAL